MEPSDALLVTCFVSSLDDQRDTQPAMSAGFPGAALDYVQMQRAPVAPAAACEATARLTKPASSSDSQMALVSSPQIVITGTQLAFGSQDSDFKLAFERLEKTLAASKNALRSGGDVASLRNLERIVQPRAGHSIGASELRSSARDYAGPYRIVAFA